MKRPMRLRPGTPQLTSGRRRLSRALIRSPFCVVAAAAIGGCGAGAPATGTVHSIGRRPSVTLTTAQAQVPPNTLVSLVPACACGRHAGLDLLSLASGQTRRKLATVPVGAGQQLATPAATGAGHDSRRCGSCIRPGAAVSVDRPRRPCSGIAAMSTDESRWPAFGVVLAAGCVAASNLGRSGFRAEQGSCEQRGRGAACREGRSAGTRQDGERSWSFASRARIRRRESRLQERSPGGPPPPHWGTCSLA
jgi:hypothetical protein